MAFSGSGLYTAVKPVLEEGCTDLMTFRTKMGAKISQYVATNCELVGAYVGTKPSGVPSVLVLAAGKLVPTAPTPPLLANPVPFTNYMKWIKDTLEQTILWNITAISPHTNTVKIFDPTVTFMDVLGDFSDIRSSYGFWAMVCDAIVCCIQGYIPTVTAATATDGSSGSITWSPVSTPQLKHNFIFRVTYDINNTQLIQWINVHITNPGDLSGDVDIPINDQPYQATLALWKGLIALTEQCSFYKKQDNGELILLTTGAPF